jgi:hypothetical protein
MILDRQFPYAFSQKSEDLVAGIKRFREIEK